MSTAHVTGSWAVLKSGVPGASVDDVLNSLKNTGVSITDTRNGLIFPRIQVDSALNDLLPIPQSSIHDMRVDAFSVSPLVVTQGDIINLQATITNVGNVDEGKVRISYRDTLTQTGIANQFRIPVDVGETVVGNVIQWDTTGAIIGDHVLRAKVQLNGFVDENPSDNDIFVTVTVQSASGPPLHDMRVDAFSVSPLVVTQGDIINLQATITNVGNVDEGKVRISYRDTLTQTGIANQFRIPVDVGETVVGNVIQWDTTGAIIGDHVLRAKVQLDNGLVDENPSDNDIFVTVTVQPPSP